MKETKKQKYKKDCKYYIKKLNKIGYVSNYCKKKNKFLCGTLNCKKCNDYKGG